MFHRILVNPQVPRWFRSISGFSLSSTNPTPADLVSEAHGTSAAPSEPSTCLLTSEWPGEEEEEEEGEEEEDPI